MKIINIVMSPKGGGAELLVREICQKLLKLGFDAKALYFNSTGVDLYDHEFTLGIASSGKSLRAILGIRKFIKKELKNAQGEELIVHAHLTYPLFFVAIATIGLNVKLFYTEHNSYNKRREYKWFRYIERHFHNRYCTIICISDGVRDSLLQWLGKSFAHKVQTVNNGARLFALQNKRKIDANTKLRILSIGSLTHQKGFDIALKALSTCFDNEVESYTIVGEGNERDQLENLIKGLKIEKYVTLTGWSDNIAKYLYEADLFLVPSRWEGFGLVVIEALSSGLPVIASDVEGLNGLFKDTDCPIFYFEKENICAIHEKIKEVKNILTIQSNIATKANLYSESYSMDTMVYNYITKYKN